MLEPNETWKALVELIDNHSGTSNELLHDIFNYIAHNPNEYISDLNEEMLYSMLEFKDSSHDIFVQFLIGLAKPQKALLEFRAYGIRNNNPIYTKRIKNVNFY